MYHFASRPSRMQKLQQKLPLLRETVQSSCLLGSCNVSRSATTRLCSVGLKLPVPNRGNKKSVQPDLKHCKIRCASKEGQECCIFCIHCFAYTVLHTLFCIHCFACTVLHALFCMHCLACTVLHALSCMHCLACTVLHILQFCMRIYCK